MSVKRPFTIAAAAEVLGLSQPGVYHLIEADKLTLAPGSKPGRVLLTRESVISCVATRAQEHQNRKRRLALAPGTLGSKLRELRQARKLSLRELGRLSGVSGQVVSQYEFGTARPGNATLQRLARALEVDLSELQDDREVPSTAPRKGSKRTSTVNRTGSGLPGRPCPFGKGPDRQQRIREMREQGLTLRQIAQELGLSLPTVAGDLRKGG